MTGVCGGWRRRLVVREWAFVLLLRRLLRVEERLDERLCRFRAIGEGEALHIEGDADFIPMCVIRVGFIDAVSRAVAARR